MNKANVEAAISIMNRAENLDMEDWQVGSKTASSIEELHKCGNTACFAGYVAISNEWKKYGSLKRNGMPYITINDFEYCGQDAIAFWLDISSDLAEDLVHGDLRYYDSFSRFYDCYWNEVTAGDVINKLEKILSGKLK